MLALLQAPTDQVPGWLQIVVAILVGLQSLFVCGGIVGAFYRFRKEKPDKGRLQPALSGVAVTKNKITHLQVGVSAENVGQVPLTLDKSATILRVTSRKTGDDEWSQPKLRNVLGQQDEIQPGETLIDQEWFEMPEGDEVAFKLELSVAENEENVSVAVEVVNLLAQGDNVPTKSEAS